MTDTAAPATPARTVARYEIIDNREGGRVVGTYDASTNRDKARKAAHRRADRMDSEYGAIRYPVRTVWNA